MPTFRVGLRNGERQTGRECKTFLAPAPASGYQQQDLDAVRADTAQVFSAHHGWRGLATVKPLPALRLVFPFPQPFTHMNGGNEKRQAHRRLVRDGQGQAHHPAAPRIHHRTGIKDQLRPDTDLATITRIQQRATFRMRHAADRRLATFRAETRL